jgi:hypothetical protein
MAAILGSSVTLQLRENGSTGAYSNVICETSSSYDGTASVTTTVTKCNTVTAVSSPTGTFSVDGIFETSPSAGQVSAEQMNAWFHANTLLDIKYEDPESTGTNFYIQGTGYMTAFNITSPAEGNVTFTAAFQMTGTIDVTP